MVASVIPSIGARIKAGRSEVSRSISILNEIGKLPKDGEIWIK
jgi:hypothetical protein